MPMPDIDPEDPLGQRANSCASTESRWRKTGAGAGLQIGGRGQEGRDAPDTESFRMK